MLGARESHGVSSSMFPWAFREQAQQLRDYIAFTTPRRDRMTALSFNAAC